jgi:Protein of unknown function (DUF3102)
MAIGDPILAFTLSRLAEKYAAEAEPAPPSVEEWAPSPRAVTTEPAAAPTPIATAADEPADEPADAVESDEGLPQANFNYAAVPPENVAEIGMLVTRIKTSRRRHVEAVHDVGAALLRAKELLGHGNFLPWLQAEFRWSERTANNYMSIARFFRGKTANFADLDIGAASALASKSTPDEIRNELLERAEAGENISREEVKERIAAGKKARKSQAAAEQAEPGDAAPTHRSVELYAPPRAIVEPTTDSAFAWAHEPPRQICSEATNDDGARSIIRAMLEIEAPLERLCSGSPGDAANVLLAAANGEELLRVQKVISFVLEIKQALDERGFRREPELLAAM